MSSQKAEEQHRFRSKIATSELGGVVCRDFDRRLVDPAFASTAERRAATFVD
jgi:hypothetical protein